MDGCNVGTPVGCEDGIPDGRNVGLAVGRTVGLREGLALGRVVGMLVAVPPIVKIGNSTADATINELPSCAASD